MRKTVSLILSMFVPIFCLAQKNTQSDSIKTIKLGEVVIQSSSVVHHNGYNSYMPSDGQRRHSANALDLLEHIQLPDIRIDLVEKKIVNTTGTGSVVVKINNVEATIEELQAILPQQVVDVEYTTSPGMKYGAGVGAVINVRTKRNDRGVAFGLNTMNALSCNYNDDGVWGKVFHGRSEFGIQYNFNLNDVTNAYTETDETLRWSNNTEKYLHKDGHFTGGNFRSDALALAYNYTKPEIRVVDIKGLYSWARFPTRNLDELVTGDETYAMRTYTQSDEKILTLKTYYDEKLSSRDEIEANIAMAYLDNKYDRGFSSPNVTNIYHVAGDKYSIRGHLDYTHTFTKSSKMALGYQQSGAYTMNNYIGTKNYTIGMNSNSQYVFAEYTASIGRLDVIAGIGVSREHFHQSEDSYTFHCFRPNLLLQYRVGDSWQFIYRYRRTPSLPTLSDLTDYSRQDDAYQIFVGNPCLKPYNKDSHKLIAIYSEKNTTVRLYGEYEYTHNAIANQPIEEKNGMFWHRLANNTNHHHYETALYVGQSLFNKQLSFYIEPKLEHDKSIGVSNHSNTCASIQIGCNAYYKNWSTNLYFRSATETLFGDILTRDDAVSDASLAYRYKSLLAKIGLKNAFNKRGKMKTTTQMSDVVSSQIFQGNRGFGNMIYLSLSWNFSNGKQPKSHHVKEIYTDVDAGILK